MKPIYAHAAGAIALTFAIAACTSAPPPAAGPAPAPARVATTPEPPPVQVPPAPNWIDVPQSPGSWIYGQINKGTIAEYGQSVGKTDFSLTCNLESRRIAMVRHSPDLRQAATMTIRTETANRALTARTYPTGPGVWVDLAATDPLFDAIALTRGRFAVEAIGAPTLYLPNWAEVTRVIEDCR